jgi:starch synthase (maltosyl-transferring)
MSGRMRVMIERVRPKVDGGRFPIKRVVGERVQVGVDLFADGHDAVAGALRYRYHADRLTLRAPRTSLGARPGTRDRAPLAGNAARASP